jgi:hypothetical protein
MKYIWALLCQDSTVDINTNALSIFKSVEEIILEFKDQPLKKKEFIIPVKMQLISLWTAENPAKNNLLEIKIDFLDPNGKSLINEEKKIDIAKGVKRARNITDIKNLKITKEGRYMFKLSSIKSGGKKFETVAELPLDIKIIYKQLQ